MNYTHAYRNYNHKDFLAAGICFVILIGFVTLLHFNGLYGQDPYEYLRYTKDLKEYYHTGIRPSIEMVFPICYSFIGSLLPNYIFSLQLLSILAFCMSFIMVYKTIMFIYKPDSSNRILIYLILFYCLSPYIFRFSVLIMSDMLATLFCTGAIYYALIYRSNSKFISMAMAVFCVVAAALTRTACAAFVIIPAVVVALQFIKKFRFLHLLGIILIIIFCLWPDYIIRNKLFIFELGGPKITSTYLDMHPYWSPLNWFRHSFHMVDDFHSYAQPNIVHVFFNVFHPAYLFAGPVFLVFLRKPDINNRDYRIVLFTILVYALFLAGQDLQNMRYLLPTFPLVVILFYPAFQRFLERLDDPRMKYFALIITVVLQLIFVTYSFITVYKANRADLAIAAQMKSYPGQTIYTFGIDAALKTYGVQNPVINIFTEKLNSIKPNSLAIVEPQVLEDQFKDHNPQLNWAFIMTYAHPKYIMTFKPGLELYSLHP